MVAWTTPGDIVRWWRTDVLGWSQPQMAEQLSVAATAVSNWEHGRRELSIDLETIDRALRGNSVLSGLLGAFGSPAGLSSSRIWTKVFPGPSTPVWMWVRSDRASMKIEGEWGVVSFEAEIDLPPNGFFVTVGGSVSQSPVVVQLSEPGWADFGRGELPRTIPGAQIVAAVDHVRPSTATGVFMTLFNADLKERLNRYQASPDRRQGRDGASFTDFADRLARGRTPGNASLWPPLPDGTGIIDRQRFASLRKARSLSLTQTTDRLARATATRLGRDTLRRFENDQGEPHDRLLPVALDHVLGAEGHLALTEIRSGQGTGVVTFPPYWYAPIWLSIDGPGDEVSLELHWATWARLIKGEPPLMLVSHYADPLAPLRIVTTPNVRWTAGVGRPAGAIPINHGWVPIDLDAAQQALDSTHEAMLEAIRRNAAIIDPEDLGQDPS